MRTLTDYQAARERNVIHVYKWTDTNDCEHNHTLTEKVVNCVYPCLCLCVTVYVCVCVVLCCVCVCVCVCVVCVVLCCVVLCCGVLCCVVLCCVVCVRGYLRKGIIPMTICAMKYSPLWSYS